MKGKNNILLVAPPFIPVSKDSVAGIEQMTYILGKSLTELGHNVFTIAREDSEVYGKLITGGFKEVTIHPGGELEHFHQAIAYSMSVVRKVIRNNPSLDIIVDRCQGISLTASHEEEGPPVFCALDLESKYFWDPVYFNLLKEKLTQRKDSFVAVSQHIAQEYINKLSLGRLSQKMHVIYNGIITDQFDFSKNHKGYILYLGRIRKGKGPHIAIEVAKKTNHKIIVAGGNISGNEDGQYEDKKYINEYIFPLLDKNVEWFGLANFEQKVELLKNSKALMFPSKHKEALPLVPLEAMACGTPVIAFDHSGAKEEIIQGETGFIVSSFNEMVNAIGKLDNIDREKCSAHIRNKFDYRSMGIKYSTLIEKICF